MDVLVGEPFAVSVQDACVEDGSGKVEKRLEIAPGFEFQQAFIFRTLPISGEITKDLASVAQF
jgi:hypothetical protein